MPRVLDKCSGTQMRAVSIFQYQIANEQHGEKVWQQFERVYPKPAAAGQWHNLHDFTEGSLDSHCAVKVRLQMQHHEQKNHRYAAIACSSQKLGDLRVSFDSCFGRGKVFTELLLVEL